MALDEPVRGVLGRLITIIFCLPFTPAAVPWGDEFDWEALNYAPLTVGFVLLCTASVEGEAHKWFTGQVRNIEIDEALGVARRRGSSPPGAAAAR